MAIPVFVAAGASASNLNAITPGMPAGVLANDILICAIETDFEVTNATLSGGTETWTEVTGSPITTGASTRLAVFWARASQASPTSPTTNDSGNHQNGQILAYRGAKTSGNPWVTTPGTGTTASSMSVSISGITTTQPNSLILYIVSGDLPDALGTAEFSGWADANLASVTERIDFSDTSGNGGSLGAAEGGLASPGASGTMTATKVNAATMAWMCLEIASDVLTFAQRFPKLAPIGGRGRSLVGPPLLLRQWLDASPSSITISVPVATATASSDIPAVLGGNSKTNTFEGGTNGTTLTSGVGGNTGGSSGDYFDTVTLPTTGSITFDNTLSAHGGLSVNMNAITVGTPAELVWGTQFGGSLSDGYGRIYVNRASLATDTRIINGLSGGVVQWSILVGGTSNGRVTIHDVSDTLVAAGTSSLLPAAGTWFRLEFHHNSSSQLEVRLYTVADDTTLTESITASGGTNSAIDEIRFRNSHASLSLNFDDIIAAATTWPGSAAVLPPVTITPAAATATAAAATPTVLATILPAAATATASSPAPAVNFGQTLSPPVATATAAAATPTVLVTLLPAAATATASAQAPVLKTTLVVPLATASANSPPPTPLVTILPAAATATASAPVPAVNYGQTLFPGAATATASAPAPTVVVTIPPAAATATATAQTPTVKETILPGAATATAAAPTPVVRDTILPAAATATAAAQTPALIYGQLLSPPAATATATAQTPVVAVTILPPAATATASAPAPSASINPISFIQSVTGTRGTAGTTLTINITSTTGNALVALVALHLDSTTVSSVTDTAGNTWSIDPIAGGNGSDNVVQVAYVGGEALGVTSVTITVNTSQVFGAEIAEFSGIATGAEMAHSAVSASGLHINLNIGSITTTADPELLVDIAAYDSITTTATKDSDGFTALTGFQLTASTAVTSYRVVSPGSYTPAWTLSAGQLYAQEVIRLQAATGSPVIPAATATASAQTPTVLTTVLPGAATATATAQTPTPSITILPGAATATASAQTPTVLATVLPGAATATASALAPSLNLPVTLTPPAATATASAQTPSTTADRLVSPPAAIATATAASPTLLTTVRPSVATATSQAQQPIVIASGARTGTATTTDRLVWVITPIDVRAFTAATLDARVASATTTDVNRGSVARSETLVYTVTPGLTP